MAALDSRNRPKPPHTPDCRPVDIVRDNFVIATQ
jgi:hypothetical protein